MVNINEAPEGFLAEKATMLCVGCYFFDETGDCNCENDFSVASCEGKEREDNTDVIFIKKE